MSTLESRQVWILKALFSKLYKSSLTEIIFFAFFLLIGMIKGPKNV